MVALLPFRGPTRALPSISSRVLRFAVHLFRFHFVQHVLDTS